MKKGASPVSIDQDQRRSDQDHPNERKSGLLSLKVKWKEWELKGDNFVYLRQLSLLVIFCVTLSDCRFY